MAGATQWLSDRRETPHCGLPTGLSHKPAEQPAGARAGRAFWDRQTSCGDTNGSTLHIAKQVREIQDPQSCTKAHRKSHLSVAPFFSYA